MPTARELLQHGDSAFSSRNYAEATETCQRAVEMANLEKDEETAAEAMAQVARGFLVQDKKEEGRPWIERASRRARPDLPLAWSRFLGVRGRFEWKDGDLPRATRTFEEMYAYCLDKGQHERAIDAAHMVGITGTPEQQVDWGRKGIEAAERGGVEGWLGPLWNNLGYTLESLERHEEAYEAYVKARHWHWKVGGEQAKLIADWAVAHAHRSCKRPDKALQWVRPVLAWAERLQAEKPGPETAEWVGLSCRELGEAEIDLGRHDAGLALLRRARVELGAAKMPEWDQAGFEKLTRRIAELEAGGRA